MARVEINKWVGKTIVFGLIVLGIAAFAILI
jgi:hypothetical protein